MASPGYRHFPIKQETAERIDEVITLNKELGYKSISDFIQDAVRRRIEELEARKSREHEQYGRSP